MFLTSIALGFAFAQSEAPNATLTIPEQPMVAGSIVRAVVELQFAPGLHAYQNPPSLEYQIPVTVSSSTANLLLVRYPAGEPAAIGGDPKPSMTYAGDVRIPVLVRLPRKAGEQAVKVSVRYQQCNDSSCFPPGTVTATAMVRVAASSKTVASQRGADLVALAAPAVAK